MEKYRASETHREDLRYDYRPLSEVGSSEASRARSREESALRSFRLAKEYSERYNRKTWKNRLIGSALALLGTSALATSCPLFLFTSVGPETALVGLGLLLGGGVFLFRKPKVKDTNQALMIALKYDNVLTVSRLALEMDISFEKAEKIIQELVRKGIAEIDLEGEGADQSLIYRIKGL